MLPFYSLSYGNYHSIHGSKYDQSLPPKVLCHMLDIPRELYTPLFAIARIVGWSAHRLEELITTDKIIRPAYKSLVTKKEYIDREKR